MKTNLFQIIALAGMLSLPVLAQEKNSNDEKLSLEDNLQQVENILKGCQICIEGRIEITDKIYYFNPSKNPAKKYRLVVDALNVKKIDIGDYIVTCSVNLSKDSGRIESLKVFDLDPIPGFSQEAVEGLIAEINDLKDMAMSDEGSKKLQANIERVKIVLLAQYFFYARHYPNELGKAKELKTNMAPKDPFSKE